MKRKNSSQFLMLVFLLLWGLFSCNPQLDPIDTNPGTSTLADTTILDVPYGSHVRQKYDLYLPANRDSNTLVLLMIHGGGWKEGQKEHLNDFVNLIRAKWSSVAMVNMNYRLASNVNNIHHNEIIADINAVVNDVKAKKSSYHISSTMGVMGHSAGGNLAMIYAYKYNQDMKCVANLAGPSNLYDWSFYNSTNLWVGQSVKDVMEQYIGQPWDSTAYKAVSPYWNVSASTQPTIIFHCTGDVVVPVYQSQLMRDKLAATGVIHQYNEYPTIFPIGHDFANEKDAAMNNLVAFFKTHLK